MFSRSDIAAHFALTPFLTADELSIGRGDRTLLSGLKLVVEAGDVLHLRGANGVGKSSLIEVLAGLRPAMSGLVKLSAPMHWIGHRNALQADLSVVENLSYWCAMHGVDVGGMPSALERLGLLRLKSRRVRTLSAGQKRRATLARLLLSKRALWLLDEPLSGLDAEGIAVLGRLMNEHIANEGGIVVTSHQSLPGRLPRVTVMEL